MPRRDAKAAPLNVSSIRAAASLMRQRHRERCVARSPLPARPDRGRVHGTSLPAYGLRRLPTARSDDANMLF